MQVENGLAGPTAVVDQSAVAFRIQPSLARQLGGHGKEMTEQGLISGYSLPERSEVLAREHQEVNRGLWVGILNRHSGVVLENNLGRRTAFDDATEDAILH